MIQQVVVKKILDVVRAKVVASENQIDDILVLPLLDKLEEVFELDEDEG